MKNLRLLDIESKYSSREPTFLPDELQWLCWHPYPYFSLPVARMRKLVGLEMVDSSIRHLWEGKKILPYLKFVDLRGSEHITKFPDVSGAPNIERLILSNCISLVEVHPSLGLHRRLVYLDMSGCWELKHLPSRIEMESLETLILSYCESLERFPEASPCMIKLSKIYLDHCDQIEELPSSIRYLSGLSFLSLIGCKNLKHIPNSICELKHLKTLDLHNCKKLQKLPEDFGSLERLEELLLGLSEWSYAGEFVSLHYLTSFCYLRKLDLSWRQIEEKDFPKKFNAFSSLEELILSGNSKLIQLPAGISHLSNLKLLELNKCPQLQFLLELPSGLQVLKARGCSSLEKIGDLTEEHEWLYKLWFFDCHKILEDQDNRRYIDKLLQKSSVKKCAAVNHRLSIGIPGSKIPSWFKEQKNGCNIELKLPPKWHTQITGFAICGVFHGDWKYACPRIIFRIMNNGNNIPKSEGADEGGETKDFFWFPQSLFYREATRVNSVSSSSPDNVSTAAESADGNLWLSYIPLDFFQQMYHDFQPQDWYHIEGNLAMTVTRSDGNKAIRCATHLIYKDDMELIHQNKTIIADYGNLVQVDGDSNHEELGYEDKASANTYVYEEKSDNKSSNSQRRNIYNRSFVYTQQFIPRFESGSLWP